MKKNALLAFILVLLSTAVTVGFVRPVEASGTIYISSDYTFTSNIYEPIVVTADNIIIDGAGYTVQGTGSGIGIDLSDRSNVTLKNIEVTNFTYGIRLRYSSNNTVTGNTASNNDYGIFLLYSSNNNTVTGNTVSSNNGEGIYLRWSSNNVLFHNNLIDNTVQASVTTGDVNTWDDGYPSGGNYWSDYPDVDLLGGPYQDETGSDGIGDSPYTIDVNNQDNYPLMGMFSDFNATSEHHVQTICNSTISDFKFNGTAISFNVTGKTDTTGFCRICIPRALMNETYQVFVNGTEVPCNLLPCSNSTHSYLYFTYNHSTQEVVIIPAFLPPDTTPPTISILSPENKTYTVEDVPLTFTVDESTSWMGYSLDGQANATITGNTTLSGLSDGSHSLMVYAKDTAGNTGTSEIIYFTIETEKEEPFPTWIVATIVIVVIIAVVGALLVYFTKVKKTT